MSLDRIQHLAAQFAVGPVRSVEPFSEKGNINPEAYVVTSSMGRYLLQRLNTDVFTLPDRVTESVRRWTESQATAVKGAEWAVPYQAVSLIPTLGGDFSYSDAEGYWRMLSLIEDVVCHKSLSEAESRDDQLRLAGETGRGLAISTRLAHGIAAFNLEPSLPGYRDTEGYLSQFHSVTSGEALVDSPLHRRQISDAEYDQRAKDAHELIEQVQRQSAYALGLQQAVARGELERTVIHGDTKLENFLFCRKTGRVKSLVDLDTVMAYTWLADWGDLARSLVNVAGEWEPDPDKVTVDEEVYEALTRGFLSVPGVAPEHEKSWMPRAVFTIAFELGMRFLTDHLRGDNYFRVDQPGGNLVRARVQLTLASRIAEFHGLTVD